MIDGDAEMDTLGVTRGLWEELREALPVPLPPPPPPAPPAGVLVEKPVALALGVVLIDRLGEREEEESPLPVARATVPLGGMDPLPEDNRVEVEQAEGGEVKDAGTTEPVAAQWGGVGVMVEERVGYPGVVEDEGAGEKVGTIPLTEGV